MSDRDIDAPTTTRSISRKLTITLRQMHKSFDQRVASIGVTRSQWTVIAVIANRCGVTQREIAEILEMSEAATGRLIDRLCTDGLVERRPKPDDRRAHCIHLTDAAHEILEKLSAIAAEHEKALFAGFEQSDLDKLEAYLDLLARNVAASRSVG